MQVKAKRKKGLIVVEILLNEYESNHASNSEINSWWDRFDENIPGAIFQLKKEEIDKIKGE